MEDRKYQTYTEVIRSVGQVKDKKLTFYSISGEQIVYSYEEMYKSSCKALGFLQKQKVKKGDKVLFQVASNYDFINGIWACMLGGFIAVPVPCSEKALDRERVLRVINGMDEVTLLCSASTRGLFEELGDEVKGKVTRIVSLADAFFSEAIGKYEEIVPDDIAMIQFSSGSTSEPKGVVITQEGLLHNIKSIAARISLSQTDKICQWIPLTHDMGLIGGHFTPTYCQVDQYIMEPNYFMKKPLDYLREVSEKKISFLIMPNFGLQYILQAIQTVEDERLDFSAVRIIFNGAEPISLEICEKFNYALKKYHLSPNTLLTVYGLAEATLAVAFPELNKPINAVWVDRHNMQMGKAVSYVQKNEVKEGTSVVSEGYMLSGLSCKICDSDGKELLQDFYGQILLKGPSIMQGYYNNVDMTKKKLTLDGWLKTGDLGFIHQDQLFVLGRQEELIIVNGQNYLSYDLENIIYLLDFMKKRKLAVLSVYEPSKKIDILVCVVESMEDTAPLSESEAIIKQWFYEKSGLLLEQIIEIHQIPKTSSGKIKRFSLQQIIEKQMELQSSNDSDKIHKTGIHTEEVEMQLTRIGVELIPGFQEGSSFTDYNISSLLVTKLHKRINDLYPNAIGIEELFRVQELSELAQRISASCQEKVEKSWRWKKQQYKDEIAIVGMALEVPGAENLGEFWENLIMGIEGIGVFPQKRKQLIGEHEDACTPNGGYLENIDMFDNRFFGILDREAIAMPPSQRLFLQTVYEAIEDAGYPLERLRDSRTGVYVGYISDSDNSTYQDILKNSNSNQTATGALSANISGRVSYTFDLKGESINIDSACSSSGAALYHAYQSVRNGECDQAIVGGIQLEIMPSIENNIGIESKEGHLRSFDNKADGTCKGEGSIAIVIKPYQEALKKKDHIYAVITSISMNQDGKTKGLSVPNPDSQRSLITETIGKASVTPKDIQYIESHGTGTNIGDPIELNTLAGIFTKKDKEQCYVGCVKPNIGHLYAASGLAGVVKCCLMLERKQIPQLINFTELNEKINIENSSLVINTENRYWECSEKRRCLISNFGFSGTNFSMLLSEVKNLPSGKIDGNHRYLFCISAKTKWSLDQAIERYRIFTIDTEGCIENICYSALCRREHYEYRVAFLVGSIEELHKKLMQYMGRIQFAEDIYYGHVRTMNFEKTEDNCRPSRQEVQVLSELCNQEIMLYKSNQNDELLRKIAELYIKGAQGDWERLYDGRDVHNVSLPAYVFEKKQFWPKETQR